MRESKRRIQGYRKLLPGLRAKLAAAAMFFVISILMMTAATFAWVTLSRSPEIKGVETTLAGNGNLEIALSNDKGTQPLESQVGDSQRSIVEKNETWGNLVNLSDAAYGLENIILRPASLNLSALSTSPLFAAEYAEDGRIDDLSSDFAYSNYDPETEMFRVPVSPEYGVRAVSSVTYTFVGGQQVFIERMNAAKSRLTRAQSIYTELCGNSENMAAIGGIMGDYLTDKFNGSTTNMASYVPYIYAMMQDFDECMEMTGEAILYIANLQILMKHGSSVEPYNDIDSLISDSKNWSSKGVAIEGLDTYISDRSTFAKHLATMEALNTSVAENGASVYWAELQNMFNFLVDINSTEVDGMAVKDIGKDEAAGLVFKSDHKGVIKKGALLNMEERLGVYMYVENLKVKAKYIISITLEADVTTQASVTRPNYIPNAIVDIEKNNSGSFAGTDPVAAETYGMAVDFWVRSNAADDYLTLEGRAITTQIQKTDSQGNKYFTNQDGITVLGRMNTDGDMEYHLEDGTEYVLTEGETLAITFDDIVIGYEGANRIWDDEELTENSATQGGGSCYVFYADTPQEQSQSLELLKSMTVVFVDDAGKLLAYADMDTESHYAETGRVTVPLKLRKTSIEAGTGENGETIYAITELKKNEAKRITALIFVDGSKITNSEVLAEADIQGQLNLQFGSTVTMQALKDEKIYHEEIHVTGEVDKDSFEGGETGSTYTSNVTLKIDGLEPKKVTANFIRQINSTQGTRMDGFTLHSNGDGTFSGAMTFTSPGTYILRSAMLDGVEYDLDEPIKVEISGFAINSVSWSYGTSYQKVMSAETIHSETIYTTFGGMVPNNVQGVFSNDDNQQITVNFKRYTANWSGVAKFTTSGVYTLKYMIIDGDYYEIPENMQKTLDLSLGMNAKIAISTTAWTYEEPKTVNVYVTVADNRGNVLTELENVSIQYLAQGSSLVENGLYSSLSWNDEAKRFEGKFDVVNAGAYEFGYLSLGGSTISSASAPVITAIPPTPPSFNENMTEKTLFAFGADVAMKVALNDSTAVAKGNIIVVLNKLDEDGNPEKDTDGNTVEILVNDTVSVTRTDTTITERSFVIPTTDELNAAGYGFGQLGSWEMTELRIIGAYYEGKITTADNPMIIDLKDKDIITTVDDEMTVKVTGEGQELNNDKLFLEAQSVTEGLVVEIQGAGGESVNADMIKAVQVAYELDVDNLTYTAGNNSAGYYTTSANKTTLQKNMKSVGTAYVKLIPEIDADGNVKYIIDGQSAPMTLPLAGTYKLKRVMFNMGGTIAPDGTSVTGGTNYVTSIENNEDYVEVPLSADSNAPAYTFEWDAPIVSVTELDPAGIIEASSDGSKLVDATNEIENAYECTVHFTAREEANLGGLCGTSIKYTVSKVTTEISNVDSFVSADMTVDGSDADITFNYTNTEKSSEQNVGTASGTSKSKLGTGAKANCVRVYGTIGNVEIPYVFLLDNPVIINNPY